MSISKQEQKEFFSSKKPQVELFNQYLSFSDLDKLEGWQQAWKSGNIADVEKLLHKAGVEVECGWEIVVINHRPRTSNLPVYGPRFQFVQRTDKEWIKMGMVGTEDLIESCKDPILRAEMILLSRRSRNTAEILEHVKNNSPEDIDKEFKEKK